MQLTRVTDCVLILEADDAADLDEMSVEVSSFSITFAMNKLPQATITPAFGRNIMTGAITDLQFALEGRNARLVATIAGVTHMFLEGVIGQVSGARSAATTGADSMSAQIVLNHKLLTLAGSPAGSYVYTSELGDPVDSYYTRSINGLFGIKDEALKESWERIGNELYRDPPGSIFLFPGHVLRDMAVRVIDKNMPELMTPEELRNRVQVYDPANFTQYSLNADLIGRMQSLLFQDKVLSGNLWEALLTCSQEFFLNIIPYASGVALANPVASLDQEQLVVNANELVAVQASRSNARPEVLRGVIAQLSTGAREGGDGVASEVNWLFAYPPLDARTNDGSVAFNILEASSIKARGGYYQWWRAPKWLNGDAGLNTSPKAFAPIQPNARVSSATQSADSRREYLASLGPVLAKMIYAQLMRDNVQVPELVFPFRTDLMPGTTIKLVNGTSVISGLGFSGRDWYGMITSVRFDLSNEGDPMLQTVVSLSYARPTQTLPGTQQIGYTSGSLFEAAWNGLRLDGTALTEAPDASEFPGRPKV